MYKTLSYFMVVYIYRKYLKVKLYMINTVNENFEDTKGVTRRKTDNIMTKRKKDKERSTSIKIEHHESHIKQHILFS